MLHFKIERLELGKVRTDTVKRTSRELIRRYPERFTGDFESDKQAVNDLVITQSKRLRNRIAGYVTRLKVVEAERIAATQVASEGSEPAPEEVEEYLDLGVIVSLRTSLQDDDFHYGLVKTTATVEIVFRSYELELHSYRELCYNVDKYSRIIRPHL